MERCCHRPGQCYLPDKEFRSSLSYVNQPHRRTMLLPHCSCMSPCRWDYIFADEQVGVWHVVSEDSDHFCSRFAAVHRFRNCNDLQQPTYREMRIRLHQPQTLYELQKIHSL